MRSFLSIDRKGDHSNEEYFVFAFSGHGNSKGNSKRWTGEQIIVNNGQYVEVEVLVKKLKACQNPTTGPKIMFLDVSTYFYIFRKSNKKFS